MGPFKEIKEVGMGPIKEVKEVGMGPVKEVKEVGMGHVKEVGMGPIKEVDIREREADGRELLCLMKSGPSSLTMW
ncbi:UNVERIFIED_CONTAM: hypothetical protein FKN15_057291 [Acipenser sinensis]